MAYEILAKCEALASSSSPWKLYAVPLLGLYMFFTVCGGKYYMDDLIEEKPQTKSIVQHEIDFFNEREFSLGRLVTHILIAPARVIGHSGYKIHSFLHTEEYPPIEYLEPEVTNL